MTVKGRNEFLGYLTKGFLLRPLFLELTRVMEQKIVCSVFLPEKLYAFFLGAFRIFLHIPHFPGTFVCPQDNDKSPLSTFGHDWNTFIPGYFFRIRNLGFTSQKNQHNRRFKLGLSTEKPFNHNNTVKYKWR